MGAGKGRGKGGGDRRTRYSPAYLDFPPSPSISFSLPALHLLFPNTAIVSITLNSVNSMIYNHFRRDYTAFPFIPSVR